MNTCGILLEQYDRMKKYYSCVTPERLVSQAIFLDK
jgi:hypothetical protein